jgi:hypothetical protein
MPQPGLASGGKVLTETVLASAQIKPPLNSRTHVLEASKIKDLDGNRQYAESALPGKQILTKPKLANNNLQVQKVQQVEGMFSESPDRQSAEPTTKSGITSEGNVYVEAGTLTSVQKKITVASKAKGVDSPMQIFETESEVAAGQQTYLTRETNSKGNAARERSTTARRSLRLNNTCSSDGISKGDEDTLEKSMKRTTWKNLDRPAPQRQPSSTEGNTISTNTLESLPTYWCISSLHSLGFSMGRSQQDTTLAIKALKQIDIDRTRVKTKKMAHNKSSYPEFNPFDSSDDEETRPDGALLSHLVRDISEVCFDDEEPDTKICDLMATLRKSKNIRKKGHNTDKNGVQMKGFFWNSRCLKDLAKHHYISNPIKEHNLDFIAIMEMGKQDMSKMSLNRLSGGSDFV